MTVTPEMTVLGLEAYVDRTQEGGSASERLQASYEAMREADPMFEKIMDCLLDADEALRGDGRGSYRVRKRINSILGQLGKDVS